MTNLIFLLLQKMITVKLLFICLTLSAILCPEMVSTVSVQDLFLEKQDKDCSFSNHASCRTHRVKRQFFGCTTPDNEIGDCINIKQCPSLLNKLIRQEQGAYEYVRKRTCSFDGKKAIVCCANDAKNDIRLNQQDPLLRPPHCGSSAGIHEKVAGGVRAKLGAWPWIAALGYRNRSNPSQPQWGCGGTLISARHVLTAAHCVDVNLTVVRIGDLNLKRSDDGAHPVQVKVAQKIIHPQYTKGIAENDIAVLKLADDVPFSKNLHPICLPIDPSLRNKNLDQYFSYIAGWGSESLNGTMVDDLMEVEIPVISNDDCKQQYSNIPGAVIDNRVICAGFRNGGKDACQGDSGGPLMLPHKSFHYYQIGVVSYSYDCAKPGYAGVYTRVTEYLDFIISAMQ